MIFSVFQKKWVLGILGSPYCGIGATIRIGREMLCLPYAGFFYDVLNCIEASGDSIYIYFSINQFAIPYPSNFL